MKITLSRSKLAKNISSKGRKYCVECQVFFDLLPLENDPHAAHYSLRLPARTEKLDSWLKQVADRDEEVWGAMLNEHGTDSQVFCPPKVDLKITD